MTDIPTTGRRERKKAATRAAILEAAMDLFLDRGFDEVSVREIADLADVSPATVFAHFPQKEALLFFEEAAQRERLVAAVLNRSAGVGISQALKQHYVAEFAAMWSGPDAPVRRRVMDLMEQTPALQEYASRMWVRNEDALAATIATSLDLQLPSDEVRAYARFALNVQLLVAGPDDPMLEAAFRILDNGWAAHESAVAPSRPKFSTPDGQPSA